MRLTKAKALFKTQGIVGSIVELIEQNFKIRNYETNFTPDQSLNSSLEPYKHIKMTIKFPTKKLSKRVQEVLIEKYTHKKVGFSKVVIKIKPGEYQFFKMFFYE